MPLDRRLAEASSGDQPTLEGAAPSRVHLSKRCVAQHASRATLSGQAECHLSAHRGLTVTSLTESAAFSQARACLASPPWFRGGRPGCRSDPLQGRRREISRSAVLLLAGAIAVLASAPVVPQTRQSLACDLINAYDHSAALCQGIFIHIDNTVTATPINCPNDTYTTVYDVTIGSTCGGTDGGCWALSNTTRISSQSGLSGNYRVDYVNGHCIKLCACP